MKERVPPGQSVVDEMPVLHAGSIPKIDPAKWEFRIFGLVEKEKILDFNEFMSLPMRKSKSDIHCVTGWSKLDNVWEGVSSQTIKNLVKILPDAKFAIVYAEGGFTTNLPIDDFFGQDVIFAVRQNGKEITPEHGWPVRLVVPRLYFWKSAKWVNGVEFAKEDRPGFWESRGYHNRGDPWKEERYG
ncbi:MAG: sulfite oxidase-like oxidoreductase [Candidatus Thermoplasmatota archaeon]|nr:sulfite oxidase-like oxidoreductase [Candidatus Thermoplasmatota archaeon]